MSNSKIIRAPISFTKEDVSHCANCIYIVEQLLSPNTDGESLYIKPDDIEYLARLLYREYNIMVEVLEASGGSDNVI